MRAKHPSFRQRSRSRRKPALVLLGCVLVVAGVVLGILPVVPGTPIVLFGAMLVSNHSPRGRLVRQRVRARLHALSYGLRSRPARASTKS